MEFLKDIGKVLAEALRDQPGLAAICLLVVIGAIVMITLKARNKIAGFLCILAFAIGVTGILGIVEVRQQREHLRNPPRVQLSETTDIGTVAQRLTDKQRKDLKTVLQKAAEEVAVSLQISPELVRANIFAPYEDEKMRIVPQLTYNMNRPEELTLNIPAGYGSTGRCFRSGKPNIAILREGWGDAAIADEELRKIHPDLQWIISVPVKGIPDTVRPIWVMNIDGLKEKRNERQLQAALRNLYAWSYAVSIIISQAEQSIARKPLDPSVRISETSALQVHSLISEIQARDIAAPTENLIKGTSGFTSISPLNAFTKDAFSDEVRKHFVSYKAGESR